MKRPRSGSRAVLLGLAAACLVLAGLAILGRQTLWRQAYPHLPRQAQALPYRLEARLRGERPTPLALPTPLGAASAPTRPTPPGSSGAGRGRGEAATVATVATTATLSARGSGASAYPALTSPPPRSPSPLGTTGPTESGSLASPAPTDRALASPSPVVTRVLPPSAMVEGLRHEYQTWNNCGPATISMALSRFGAGQGQAEAARSLKPDPDDKNVGPQELADYARSRGMAVRLGVGGDADLLRGLLAAGLPVVVETWFIPDPNDEMGHYRVLVGYDAEGFRALDSYHGPNVRMTEAELDKDWRVFNRLFLVAYPPDQAPIVEAVLGPADERAMHERAAARAMAEIGSAEDAFGWFNLGSSLLALGDAPAAAEAFDRARGLGLPWRMLWYQHGPFEAYAATSRWTEVRALAEANLTNADNLEESHYWLGRALAATGDPDGARRAWERALALNPRFAAAAEALAGGGPGGGGGDG